MKKIYSILLSAAVCLMGLAACTHDYPVGEMARNISVAPDAQQTAAAGQTFDVTVTADGAWVADTPDWISVTPANGEGNATVKVTVAANEGGERTDNVKFYSAVGDVSSTTIALESTPLAELTVVQAAGEGQGGGDNTITIADYLALGANTDPYIITGTITRVANTNYGNFDLTDETGTIYIYGLLNEELEAQKCWKEKELAMGDILTIQASNLQFYEKDQIWEIVNAVYVSHEKSLIDVDAELIEVGKEGADFTVVATVKGEDVKVDFDADWITFNGATKDGEEVTLNFTADANTGVPRSAVITASTTPAKGETSTKEIIVKQDGSILTKTVAEVLEAPDDENVLYRVTGYISKVSNMAKGRIYITDYTGTVYAFGTRTAKDSESIDLTTLGIEAGDIVTIIGYKTTYTSGGNSTIELVGYVEDFTEVEEVTVEQFLAKEVSADKWYRLKGIVTRPNEEETAAGNKFDIETYGNFRLVDETGRAYVWGVLTGLGQPNNKLFGELGVAEGDEIVIVGNRAEFKSAPQVGKAWYVSHSTSEEPLLTVTQFAALEDGATDNFKGVVAAKGAKGVIVTDGTTNVYVFSPATTPEVGDEVKVAAQKTTYYNLVETSSGATVEVLASGKPVPASAAVDITSTFDDYPDAVHTSELVKVEGTVAVSGSYQNLNVEGATKRQGSLQGLSVADYDGKKVRLTGYYIGTSGKGGIYVVLIVTGVAEIGGGEEPAFSGITFTDAQLPTAYPTEEATFTQDGYECYILNVANYGNGIQIKKNGGYIANKTVMPSDIKTITLTGSSSKDYYPGNLKVYVGSTEKPAGEAMTGTLDESGKVETFAIPAGCKFFRIVNESGYAVYLASVKVE